MKPGSRILITGITGFVGAKLKKLFLEQGFDVWGISRQRSLDRKVIQGDLSSHESTAQAFSEFPDFSIIIHAAALAHSSNKSPQQSYLKVNSDITKNFLQCIKGKKLRIIFLSSVAVYGLDGREYPVTTDDKKRPSSEYGLSKLECEEAIQQSGIEDYYILRPTPVFDDDHMDDIKKRVYFPGQNLIKLTIYYI